MDRPFDVCDLDHVVLNCVDMPAMLEFYTGILGLSVERRIDAIGLVQLRAGASLVDLVAGRADDPAGPPVLNHFCLGVRADDMDVLVRFLAERKVEQVGDPAERYGARGMGPSVYVRDPEGNVVELKLLPPPGLS